MLPAVGYILNNIDHGLSVANNLTNIGISYIVGVLFGLGLMIAGMTRRAKIGAFLTLDQNWDPSLLFVLGVGVLVNLILFNYYIRVRYNNGYSENKLVLEKLFLLFQVTALIGNLLLELYALD